MISAEVGRRVAAYVSTPPASGLLPVPAVGDDSRP